MSFVVILLFLISKHSVPVLSSADAPRVDYVADKDATVADFARMGSIDDDFYRRLHKLVAANNGQRHTLDDIRRILDATLDAFLSALTDAVYVVILKPINVRRKQGFLDFLELGLPDDCFNLLHTLNCC